MGKVIARAAFFQNKFPGTTLAGMPTFPLENKNESDNCFTPGNLPSMKSVTMPTPLPAVEITGGSKSFSGKSRSPYNYDVSGPGQEGGSMVAVWWQYSPLEETSRISPAVISSILQLAKFLGLVVELAASEFKLQSRFPRVKIGAYARLFPGAEAPGPGGEDGRRCCSDSGHIPAGNSFARNGFSGSTPS